MCVCVLFNAIMQVAMPVNYRIIIHVNYDKWYEITAFTVRSIKAEQLQHEAQHH